MELIYIEVGVKNDGFYNSLLVMEKISGKDRVEIIRHIESAIVNDQGGEYFDKSCKLLEVIYREDRRMCRARIKFQNM